MAERLLGAAPGLPRLYARVIADALPLGRLTGAPDTDEGRNGNALAELSVRLTDVTADPDRLAAYRQVCGFARLGAETLPATYPHLLAFGLHLSLMSDARFPFPVLGAVHIANRIVQHRRIGDGESMDLTVSAEGLRPHPRGRQVTLVTEAEVSRQVVWRAETVLLHRERAVEPSPEGVPMPADVPADVPADGPAARPGLAGTAPSGPVRWRLTGDLGRRYARVSGDVNPIHLFDATAKPFGFSRHIAHGMWTKASCLAALSNRLDDAFTIDVAFRRPITLPSTVHFGARDDGSALEFGVSSLAGPSRTDSRSRPDPDSRPDLDSRLNSRKPLAAAETHLVGRITGN